ncbi:hypothetical protein M430DRAFT_17957 [Amorphotheca resinae ATCC 22711]|uniref:Uncharacterized protein n=1 Tax=Amorphotheca resinae ATCC 22711 TaxID=857342 RepID=A0A2T3B6K6_AMORE|nr:hypothetical protein M430DRAFT_17957 [Amorphotheca resinae ATCC 22711]PSS22405.1 hypothetical protein M430DRAFT_17957 [Amorphotheca resinae ATCC 22711]
MAQSGGGNLEEKKQQQKQQTARGSSGGASRAASSGLRREEASAAEQKNQRSKLQKHACPRDRMRSRSFICGQFFTVDCGRWLARVRSKGPPASTTLTLTATITAAASITTTTPPTTSLLSAGTSCSSLATSRKRIGPGYKDVKEASPQLVTTSARPPAPGVVERHSFFH